jgi:hypothetical protein
VTMQQEAIFEAPIAHEAHLFAPETQAYPESTFEWEHHEASHNGEMAHQAASAYSTEWEDESSFESTFESSYEDEWSGEAEANLESDRFLGGVLSAIGSAVGLESSYEDEWSGESDQFFGGLKKAFRAVKSIARSALPIATKMFGSMIPGGALLAPMAGRLAGQLLKEGEAEASALEAHLFSPESLGETGSGEAAYEAALTEVLAAEAANSNSESEASSIIASTLPITITIMGGRRSVRPVVPAMAQANRRLVRVLRRQGPVGAQLVRTLPAINRRALGTLRAASRAGRPITGPLAIRAMAGATRRVLGNPAALRRALSRNAAVNARVGSQLGGSSFRTVRSAAYRPLATTRSRLGY